VPAIIEDLRTDGEDESAVAQVVQDAFNLGLLHRDALDAIAAPHADAYGHTDAETFAQLLAGDEPTQ